MDILFICHHQIRSDVNQLFFPSCLTEAFCFSNHFVAWKKIRVNEKCLWVQIKWFPWIKINLFKLFLANHNRSTSSSINVIQKNEKKIYWAPSTTGYHWILWYVEAVSLLLSPGIKVMVKTFLKQLKRRKKKKKF